MDITALLERRDALQKELASDSLSGAELDERITEAESVATEIRSYNERVTRANEARRTLADTPVERTVRPTGTNPATREDRVDDLVTRARVLEQIAEDDGFKELRAGRSRNWSMRLNAEQTRALFQPMSEMEQRTAISTTGVVINQPLPGIVGPLTRALRVADLFDRQSTKAGALSYVQETTSSPGLSAAETAEGSSKPTSAPTFVVQNQTFAKIAHIIPVTMEALEDNGQLEGYLRGRMLYGLDYRLDSQLLNGNGTTPNLKGVLNISGVGTQAPGGTEQRIITLRKAKTTTLLADVMANDLTVVINPADWEKVDLAVSSGSGEFLSQAANYSGVGPRIWGMPVVESNAIASGTAVIGAFKQSTIWDRMEATLAISDSNQDYFEKNILTLRAELRVGLEVALPKTITVVTFNGTT